MSRRPSLLCKEVGVELFSNISGLIYLEFEQGKIENIFELIRKSVESANAGEFAKTVPVVVKDASVRSLFDELNEANRSTVDRLNTIQQIAETKAPDRLHYLGEIARGKGDFAVVEKWAAEAAMEAIKSDSDIPNLHEYAMGKIPEIPQGDGTSMGMIALKIFNDAFYTSRKEASTRALDGILSMMSEEGNVEEKKEDLEK